MSTGKLVLIVALTLLVLGLLLVLAVLQASRNERDVKSPEPTTGANFSNSTPVSLMEASPTSVGRDFSCALLTLILGRCLTRQAPP